MSNIYFIIADRKSGEYAVSEIYKDGTAHLIVMHEEPGNALRFSDAGEARRARDGMRNAERWIVVHQSGDVAEV